MQQTKKLQQCMEPRLPSDNENRREAAPQVCLPAPEDIPIETVNPDTAPSAATGTKESGKSGDTTASVMSWCSTDSEPSSSVSNYRVDECACSNASESSFEVTSRSEEDSSAGIITHSHLFKLLYNNALFVYLSRGH